MLWLLCLLLLSLLLLPREPKTLQGEPQEAQRPPKSTPKASKRYPKSHPKGFQGPSKKVMLSKLTKHQYLWGFVTPHVTIYHYLQCFVAEKSFRGPALAPPNGTLLEPFSHHVAIQGRPEAENVRFGRGLLAGSLFEQILSHFWRGPGQQKP